MMNEQQKILKTLRDFGKLPSYRISAITMININRVGAHLEELEKEGKVIKMQFPVATYWEIRR